MAPNLVNALIGVLLVYAATLDPLRLQQPAWLLPAAGVFVLIFAFWARNRDPARWYSGTNIVLGILLLLLFGAQRLGVAAPLLVFWVALWVGILVAIIALWAVLYRPTVLPILARKRTGGR